MKLLACFEKLRLAYNPLLLCAKLLQGRQLHLLLVEFFNWFVTVLFS